jgi:hypothetical protein
MRRAFGVAVAALAWLYTAAHFVSSGVRQPLANFTGDFLASFPAWQLCVLFGRLDLFEGSLARYWAIEKFGGDHPLWHYGPAQHLITLPLYAFPDLHSAYTVWLAANYAFLFAILVLASRVFESGRAKWVWLSFVVLAALNYSPLYEALTQRNIEIFELLLIFVAFALGQKHRETGAGIAIGLAAMTKFLPLIFLPHLVLKRRFRALAASMMAIVPLAVGAQMVLDWRYSGILIQLRRGSFIDTDLNQSLSGMIIRLLKWTRSSLSAETMSRAAIAFALLGVCWLLFRARECRSMDDLEWSTLIVAMVLLPPHNQQYYFVLLLFPYLALLARELRPDAPPHRARSWWLAISFVLTGTVIPLSVLSKLIGVNVFYAYLAYGVPFVGAGILAVICVRSVISERTTARNDTNVTGGDSLHHEQLMS